MRGRPRLAVVTKDADLLRAVAIVAGERHELYPARSLMELVLPEPPDLAILVVDAATGLVDADELKAGLAVFQRLPAVYLVQVPCGFIDWGFGDAVRRVVQRDSGDLALRAALRAMVAAS